MNGSVTTGRTTGPAGRPVPATAAVEEATGPSRGPVVLDIGGEVGAVVILTGAELDGTEIEVRPHGLPWDGTHVAVRSRPAPGEPVHAAVFSQLRRGTHEFRLRPPRPGAPTQRVEVVGGGLVEFRWPARRTVERPTGPPPGGPLGRAVTG